MDSSWEKNVYAQGKHMNLYPYDLVVSIFARKFFHIPKEERNKIRILDLGCGAGNNAKFFAENGFTVHGIDGSNSAIEVCRKRFAERGLEGDFREGDFRSLPYDDNFFDAVLDRESLYANAKESIQAALDEIRKKLRPGGYVVSFMYSKKHPDFGKGREIEPNTFDMNADTESSMHGSGIAHFADEREIKELFSGFEIENIMSHSVREVLRPENRFLDHNEFIIIAKK